MSKGLYKLVLALYGSVVLSLSSSISSIGEENYQIHIDRKNCKLSLYKDEDVIKEYPIAVGKASTPTPTGSFHIVNIVDCPDYYTQGKHIPYGPKSPVGDVWMGLDIKGYGIHGTNEPWLIGKKVSHGCIRMSNQDVKDLEKRILPILQTSS